MAGPLSGLRIIELAGIGPGPFAGMMLADMGADVIHVDRPGGNPHASFGHTVLLRNRRSVAVDLKTPQGAALVRRLAVEADGFFEGFRPGVAERLGVGPDEVMADNPRLVYGRMTGWGQDGPLAPAVGHDINYIALSGVLHGIGEPDRKPVVPLNLVGDFGGGGLLLAFGMVCGLLQAQRSGHGQVVDAAMVDGASALMAMFFGMMDQGLLTHRRGANMLDGGAPFYDTYQTADGRWISLGAIEPQFWAAARELLGIDDDPRTANHLDVTQFPVIRQAITAAVASRTLAEWDERLLGSDVCYAPVLTLEEAVEHPHNISRGVHQRIGDEIHPSPAPRFSVDTPGDIRPSVPAGTDTAAVLSDFGVTDDEIAQLRGAGAIATPSAVDGPRP